MGGMRYQPQGLQRLSDSPLNRGMAALFNPASQTNVVNGRGCTVLGNPTRSLEKALGGIAFTPDGNTDAWTTEGAYRGTGADITMFAFARLNGRTTSRALLATSSSTNAGVRIEWSQSNNRVMFTKGGVANIIAAAGMDMDFDVPYFFGVSYRHATGLVQFYLKNLNTGVAQTSTATHTNAWIAGDGIFGYGGAGFAPSTSWAGGIGVAGIAMRAMSVTELAAIGDNPWQLFQAPDEDDYASAVAAPTGHTLTASAGAFETVGRPTALQLSRTIAALPAAYAVLGAPAGLVAQRTLATPVGTIALAGSGTTLRASRRMAGQTAGATWTSQDAALAVGRRLAAGVQAYSMTALPAPLVYTPTPIEDRVLPTAAGDFAAAGQPATLKVSRRVITAPAALAVAGSTAALTYAPAPNIAEPLIANSASFAASGVSVALKAARRISAVPGSFTAITNAAGLMFGGAQVYARAPAGPGYSPRRAHNHARPAAVSAGRPAQTQENDR